MVPSGFNGKVMIKKGDLVQYLGVNGGTCNWYGMVKHVMADGICEIMWFGTSAQKLIGVMDFIPPHRLRKVNDLPRL